MSNMSNREKQYTTAEVAEIIGLTGRQVLRLCKQGRPKGAYQGDPTNSRSPWIIPQSALDSFLRLREAQANR